MQINVYANFGVRMISMGYEHLVIIIYVKKYEQTDFLNVEEEL